MSKPEVRLENWDYDFYSPGSLRGEAYGHPRFEDGTVVRTSYVDEDKRKEYQEGDVVETQNTLYTLGKKFSDG